MLIVMVVAFFQQESVTWGENWVLGLLLYNKRKAFLQHYGLTMRTVLKGQIMKDTEMNQRIPGCIQWKVRYCYHTLGYLAHRG